MSIRNRYLQGSTAQPLEPKGEDPAISHFMQSLIPNGFKVLLTLAGAAPGLYVTFYLPTGIVYVGPFAALIGIICMAKWVFGFGRGNGATAYEIVEHKRK